MTRKYEYDDFSIYSLAEHLEKIIKSSFHNLESKLLDIPNKNNASEIRRIMIDGKDIVSNYNDLNNGCVTHQISLILNVSHDDKLTESYTSERVSNFIEFNSDVMVDYDKLHHLARFYTDRNLFGVLLRINDDSEDVRIDGKVLTRNLYEVSSTHRNSYISAIDFYTDGFPKTILISENSCKDLLEHDSKLPKEDYL